MSEKTVEVSKTGDGKEPVMVSDWKTATGSRRDVERQRPQVSKIWLAKGKN